MQRYRRQVSYHRRPFWLPASNYYILAASVAIAFFFLFWGILNDGQDDAPWIPAGIGAAVVLGSAVVLREIILRGSRRRFALAQQQIGRNIRGVVARVPDREPAKLTLERNAAVLREIATKSDAAKVLGRFAEGHREVFELCNEYMNAVRRELPHVGAGSPRIAALLRGSDVAGRYHHYHLLQWAEIESRSLTKEARRQDKVAGKLASAEAALEVVDFALRAYPNEAALLDSQKVLHELITSIRISDLVDRADRAAFKGNHTRALGLYQDALFLLRRTDPHNETEAVLHLQGEIEKMRRLTTKEL